MPDAVLGLGSAGPVPRRDPPKRGHRLGHPLEPLPAPAQDFAVRAGVDKRGEIRYRPPYRHVHENPGAVTRVPFERAHRGRVTVFGLQSPDEPGCGVGQRVDRFEVVDEVPQLRIRQRGHQPANVHLREFVGHGVSLPGSHRAGQRVSAERGGNILA